MPEPIPEEWLKRVVEALKTYDDHVIEWTGPAFQRWHSDSFGGIRGDAYPSLIASLSASIVLGNETTSYPGQSATYEFFFQYGSRQMYGKIALKDDGVRILILSAHKPKRSSL